MEVDSTNPDEDYVLSRARKAFQTDAITGKAWMITAKTLYPQNFSVQFEAYKYEKSAQNVKEAARCFSDLVGKFQDQPEFWKEINAVTQALRTDGELDTQSQFLCEMFKHISTEVQHKLLVKTAEHCEDTQEHCKLLLLLLQKFPSSISSHGTGLIETLLSAEKHNLSGGQPVNQYRELLICELIPLLNEGGSKLTLASKQLYKLLHKAIEYYLYLLWNNISNKKDDAKQCAEDSWSNLYKVFTFVAFQLGWESFIPSFSQNWCRDSYWQKVVSMFQAQNFKGDEQDQIKQFSYAIALFFLYNLYQYLYCLNMDNIPGQSYPSYLLVQAFVNPNLPSHIPENPVKRRKSSEANGSGAQPIITTEKRTHKNIVSSFTMAANCWDLIHSSEQLNREFVKLSGTLNLELWLSTFLVDYLTFKDKHDDALRRLENDVHFPQLPKFILKAEVYFLQRNYIASYDNICEALQLLPTEEPIGEICEQLAIGGTQRHLHFLPLTRIAILQYLSKFILQAIRTTGFKTEMSVGHCFVLMQMDWPHEEDFLPALIQEICKTRTFYYLHFQSYLIEIDLLEELAFLWNSQNGQITFEILPNMQVRRIGTRGADKGLREEIKFAIKKQIEKSNESVYELILKFLLQERTDIAHCLK